jgi:cell division protein FtsB
MRNLQQKNGWRNILQSKPILTVFGILILFFAYNILGFWNKMQETEKNKKIVEDKITALEQQKEKLSFDINSLNTNEGKEKLFRENFGLAKDGEDTIVIVEDKNPPVPPKPASGGFFGFLKNLFK